MIRTMLRTVGRGVAGLAALSMAGCAAVETKPFSGGKVAEGIAYHLPIGVVHVAATDADGVISIVVGNGRVVPDNRVTLVARGTRDGLADNDVQITVDTNNMLSKVDATSSGQLGTIITNLVNAAVLLQGSESTSGTTFFSRDYTIDQLATTATAEVNAALVAHFTTICGATTLPRAAELAALGYQENKQAQIDRQLDCRAMILAGVDTATSANGGRGLVLIDADEGLASPDTSPAPTAAADRTPISGDMNALCARGICYRPLKAYRVRLRIVGVLDTSDTFLLPDLDRLVFVDLSNGVFAQQKYTMLFTNGVLTDYTQNRKSEVAAFSALPVTIVTSILSAPAAALNRKQSLLQAQTNYLTANATLADKVKSLQATCQASPTACTPTTYKILKGSITQPARTSNSDSVGGGSVGGGVGGGSDPGPGDGH